MAVEQTHPCIQETNIAVLKIEISHMTKKQDEILNVLNKFIESAEKRFATKEELEQVKEQLKEQIGQVKTETEKTNKSINWFVITILTIILGGMVYSGIHFLANK